MLLWLVLLPLMGNREYWASLRVDQISPRLETLGGVRLVARGKRVRAGVVNHCPIMVLYDVRVLRISWTFLAVTNDSPEIKAAHSDADLRCADM
jgi:hypothetical protein